MASIGCKAPKLRIFTEAVIAQSESQADELVRSSEKIGSVPVLLGSPKVLSGKGEPGGSLRVLDYRANAYELEVEAQRDAWLYLADAWHEGWSATVDSRPVEIRRANLAFMSVGIEKGRHIVKFSFERGGSAFCAYFIAVFSILAAAGMLCSIIYDLLLKRQSENRK